jgi:hypothetical protein
MGLDFDSRKEHARVSHQDLHALGAPNHAEAFSEPITDPTTDLWQAALIVLFHLRRNHSWLDWALSQPSRLTGPPRPFGGLTSALLALLIQHLLELFLGLN